VGGKIVAVETWVAYISSILRRPIGIEAPAYISCLADMFPAGAVVRTDQGSWARRYLSTLPPDADGNSVTECWWSPAETQAQVELLVQQNNRDMRMQLDRCHNTTGPVKRAF
jgi:hypothetical protein